MKRAARLPGGEQAGELERAFELYRGPYLQDCYMDWAMEARRDLERRLIEPAASGGATFYRLRVEGFADLDDARRFCEVFKAEGAECVPTAVR